MHGHDVMTPGQEPTYDEDGNELTPEIIGVSNIQSYEYYRYTIPKDKPTPVEVQEFLDNSKGL